MNRNMKKFMMYALLIPAMAVSFWSCSNSKTNVQQLEGKWNITEVNGEAISTQENTPFMEFNMAEKKIHGNAGCNIFNTSLETDANDISALKIAQGMSTMMACPDMETESKILQAMTTVRAVKAGTDANQMLLVDEAGKTVFVLSK
jgi:heat shock protein HslJ